MELVHNVAKLTFEDKVQFKFRPYTNDELTEIINEHRKAALQVDTVLIAVCATSLIVHMIQYNKWYVLFAYLCLAGIIVETLHYMLYIISQHSKHYMHARIKVVEKLPPISKEIQSVKVSNGNYESVFYITYALYNSINAGDTIDFRFSLNEYNDGSTL